MGVGAAAATCRRITVSVVGTNFTVFDSATGNTTTTALAGAGTQTLNLFTLPGGEIIVMTKQKHRTSFTGGAVTLTTCELGRAAGVDIYAPRFNCFQAVGDTMIARQLTHCPQLRLAMSDGRNGAGAAGALGLVVGDRVIGLQGFSVAAGYTSAGSEAAAFNSLTPGVDVESVITVNDQIQQLSAANLTDGSVMVLAERGGGLESDVAAGTAINALFRTTGANVNALTAGVLDIWFWIIDTPQPALGVG